MNFFKRCIGAFAIAIALVGCATAQDPHDPFEGFNRAMFSFNDAIDKAALKPAATAYQNVLPSFAQVAVGNFFGNIGDVWTAVNNFLQGNAADGFTDVMRVIVNSTFGLGGLIDIGSDAGMTKHNEDFGQTLGVWGVPSGPYVVLPFLGPTTLRDSVALPVDVHGDLWSYKTPVRVRNAGAVLRVIDRRSVVLDATNLIEDVALDRYEFIKDGYLQRRQNSINNGGSRKSERDDGASLKQDSDSLERRSRLTVVPFPAISNVDPSMNRTDLLSPAQRADNRNDISSLLPDEHPVAAADPVGG